MDLHTKHKNKKALQNWLCGNGPDRTKVLYVEYAYTIGYGKQKLTAPLMGS